ncbi:MAG: thioredoxin domain-containing protein [Nanoarchaeota archaeon]
MNLKKAIAYILLAAVVAYGSWWFWSELNPPDYRVMTEKPIFGNISSLVTVIEFGDLECPACKATNPTIQQIKDKYKDRIQFKYMHFPLVNIHKDALRSAEAIECANDQGRFFDYIDEAYKLSPDLSRKSLIGLAEKMGMNSGNFTACLDSGFKEGVVMMDLGEGQRRGVNAIPAIFINDNLAQEHSFAVLSNLIDEELGKTAK